MSSFPVFSSKVATEVDVSALADGAVLGQPIDMARLTKVSVQAILQGLAGAAVDTFIKLQASDVNDYSGSSRSWSDDPLHWVDVTSAQVALVDGTNCVTFSAADLPSRYIRVVFDSGAGTITAGTLDLWVTCKNG